MAGIIHLRRDTHHDAGIGITLGTRILAHAVGDHAVLFRGRRHHRAARAHTEAVNIAPVFRMVHQLIIRRAKDGMARTRPKTRHIDDRLRMLDTEADGEGLGLHIHAAVMQHLERIARAMADSQHHMVGRDALATFQHYAVHLPHAVARFDIEIRHPALPAIFATQRFDGGAHILHHLDQAEGADMRVCLGEDIRRRLGRHKFRQHLAAEKARIFDLAVELAVGEGAGATLAILHVRLGIELRFAPEAPGVFRALAHHLAAFEDDGAKPHLRQYQCSEQPARPGADHYRPMFQHRRRLRHELVGHVRRRLDVIVLGKALQDGGLVPHLHIQRIDQLDGRFLPRIVAALEHRTRKQIRRRNTQPRNSRPGNGGGRMVERQLDFGEAQHVSVMSNWRSVANGFRTHMPDFAAIVRHKINYISSEVIRNLIQ